jgi:hypothetical protein
MRLERPECIVLEASGVAEPSSIALTFMDDARDQIRLTASTCHRREQVLQSGDDGAGSCFGASPTC